MTNAQLSFDSRQVMRNLSADLPERSRQIIKKRFGLDSKESMTLEAIGKIYNITRERVRQIEEVALQAIKKSSAFGLTAPIFEELKVLMEGYGGVVHEQEFLDHITSDQIIQNNIHLLLVLSDVFVKLREDDSFHHRWTVDQKLAGLVHQSIKNLAKGLSADDLFSEKEMFTAFFNNLAEGIRMEHAKENVQRWLKLSKEIGLGPTGEWGLSSSPNVRVRGIRDYAYLILRRHGSPLHFSEVAKAISDSFGVKANAATTHNELIKDNRFVLVGRGIYALAEWGYRRGTVRDVITHLLKTHGQLTKDEVMAKVLKERYVKESTILVNLKDHKFFKLNKDGKYVLQSR